MNLNFIKEILTSEDEYWIVAKKCEVMKYSNLTRVDDEILIISIPDNIRRGLTYEEITLNDVEKLHDSYINQNIFISNDYAPFQRGISFRDFYKGFPIKTDIQKFLIKALELKSKDLYDYQNIL